MRFRTAQLLFFPFALVSAAIVLIPLSSLPFVTGDNAALWYLCKIGLFPAPPLCIAGALWAGKRARQARLSAVRGAPSLLQA